MSAIVVAAVIALFTYLAKTADRIAARVLGRTVLTYSQVWKVLVQVFWLFPAGAALVAAFYPPSPGEGWMAVALIAGFSAICLPLTLEVFQREIELSKTAISQKSAWSKPVTIPWKEVRDVAWTPTSEIRIRPVRGRSIRVSAWLSGMETFADTLETRLAHLPSMPAVVGRIRAILAAVH
jgi:hypothetical protein